jgi:hypothetical protein
LLLCQSRARFEGVEDDADEESFEAADGLAPRLALGAFALEVDAGWVVVTSLGDRDPVERGVELAVAAAVEAVALDPLSSLRAGCVRRGVR